MIAAKRGIIPKMRCFSLVFFAGRPGSIKLDVACLHFDVSTRVEHSCLHNGWEIFPAGLPARVFMKVCGSVPDNCNAFYVSHVHPYRHQECQQINVKCWNLLKTTKPNPI